MARKPVIKTTLHTYTYDILEPLEEEAYERLCDHMREKGVKLSRTLGFQYMHPGALNNKEIELETNFLFGDQWNTTESSGNLRLWDWNEVIPEYSKSRKHGYWLEQTREMIDIRQDTLVCGYCGKYVDYDEEVGDHGEEGETGFCNKCLDSEYLEEKDLHLLRLRPVSTSFGADRAPLTEGELAWLKPKFLEAQLHGTGERSINAIKKERADLEREYAAALDNAEANHRGYLWLIDHNISRKNCIFYKHTGRFGFGWRKELSTDESNALSAALADFPYEYDIKEVSK